MTKARRRKRPHEPGRSPAPPSTAKREEETDEFTTAPEEPDPSTHYTPGSGELEPEEDSMAEDEKPKPKTDDGAVHPETPPAPELKIGDLAELPVKILEEVGLPSGGTIFYVAAERASGGPITFPTTMIVAGEGFTRAVVQFVVRTPDVLIVEVAGSQRQTLHLAAGLELLPHATDPPA